MPRRKRWGFHPDSGGVKVPDDVKRRTEERIRRYAEENFGGRYNRLDIRFRGQFCYVDAYTEPDDMGLNWPPADWPETREEYMERMRNTPTHLCRLRYFGNEEGWGFVFSPTATRSTACRSSPTVSSWAGRKRLTIQTISYTHEGLVMFLRELGMNEVLISAKLHDTIEKKLSPYLERT